MTDRISKDCFFVKTHYKFNPADNICLTSPPPVITWLDLLHRNEQICRLKLIYAESISVFGAGSVQLSVRNKSMVINIINILRDCCHSEGEKGFLPHIFEANEISYFLAAMKNKSMVSLHVIPCRFVHRC